jgi:hypothetical protein
MLKYKTGDKIKVNDKINIGLEGCMEQSFINEIGIIIEANENGTFPYLIKFNNPTVEYINKNVGYRLFDDYELDLA